MGWNRLSVGPFLNEGVRGEDAHPWYACLSVLAQTVTMRGQPGVKVMVRGQPGVKFMATMVVAPGGSTFDVGSGGRW